MTPADELRESTSRLRVDPLPVRLDAGTDQIGLYVGDRKVASAWGPAADDPDTWFLWNGRSEPYRIGGGRDGAASLIDDLHEEWRHHEDSLWHPSHGEVDANEWVATAPPGVGCVGCGRDLSGHTNVSTVVYLTKHDSTRHYVCDNCEPYYKHDDEDDG